MLCAQLNVSGREGQRNLRFQLYEYLRLSLKEGIQDSAVQDAAVVLLNHNLAGKKFEHKTACYGDVAERRGAMNNSKTS